MVEFDAKQEHLEGIITYREIFFPFGFCAKHPQHLSVLFFAFYQRIRQLSLLFCPHGVAEAIS